MKDKRLIKSKVHKTKSSITVISGYLQMLNANIINSEDKEIIEKNEPLIKKVTKTCRALLEQIREIENDLD